MSVQTLGVGGVPAPAPAPDVVLITHDSTEKLKITRSNVTYDGGGHSCGPIEIKADGVTVQNFRIKADGQYGVVAEGRGITIQNNDIKAVKVSGDGDLNAITAFGDHLRILYNTAIDFVTGDPGGSHTDFFQTWISDSHPTGSRDVTIQGNKAIGPANPSMKNEIASIHQCVMAEGRGRGGNSGGSGDLERWTISDNEFGDSWNQCIKLDGVSGATITRNRFVGSSRHIVEVTDASDGVEYYSDNVVTGSYGSVGVPVVAGHGPGAPPTGSSGGIKPFVAAAHVPQNLQAVVEPDNSIILTWDAVPGATAVTVRETASPDGVKNMPLPGSATSDTRTPHTLRRYTYWITATVGGAETTPSNSADVTLPFGSDPGPGGGGATGSPADILHIGAGAAQNHFNVGVGYASGHRDHSMTEIIDEPYAESPYFTPNASGDAVQFAVFAGGRPIGGVNKHPRSELREMEADATTKASWKSTSGPHVMSGISRITHLPPDSDASGTARPWICFAQIHDTKNEDLHLEGGDIVRLQVEGNFEDGFAIWARTHTPNGDADHEDRTRIADSYTVNDDIRWKIECTGGTATIFIDGAVKATVEDLTSTTCYFKAGNYQQFSTQDGDGGYPDTACSKVELRDLVVTHHD